MKWSQGFSFMGSLEANYTIVRAHKNVNYETQFHCLQPEKKNISHHAESHQPHLQHVLLHSLAQQYILQYYFLS